MSYDVGNFTEYNIISENQLSVILSHFDTQIIYNIIKDIISKRPHVYNFNIMTNMVASYEAYFKQIELQYPSERTTVLQTRNDTYLEVINLICNNHGLTFNNNFTDLYSTAFYLYDFLISNFNNYLIKFFTNFIMKEKNYLYDLLNMNDLKKNKDSSTLYNKKIYKNPKLAVVVANIDFVVRSMCIFDVPFQQLLDLVYEDKNIAKFIGNNVSPIYDFFKTIYVPLINSSISPILISNIRLEIQSRVGDELSINDIN